jgi:hypothetical protein
MAERGWPDDGVSGRSVVHPRALQVRTAPTYPATRSLGRYSFTARRRISILALTATIRINCDPDSHRCAAGILGATIPRAGLVCTDQ